MSLLFDHNLSRRLPRLLAAEFPGSKDADFAALSAALGPPPKVIRLRIGNGPTREVVTLLRGRAADLQAFLADPSRALLELP